MDRGRFVTVINCMDGRTQIPVTRFLTRKYGVDYVDTITLPGPNKILAENQDCAAISIIRKMLSVSVLQHGSKQIAVVGHADCVGNPDSKANQIDQIVTAVKNIMSWGIKGEIIGLWVDETWTVHEVEQAAAGR